MIRIRKLTGKPKYRLTVEAQPATDVRVLLDERPLVRLIEQATKVLERTVTRKAR